MNEKIIELRRKYEEAIRLRKMARQLISCHEKRLTGRKKQVEHLRKMSNRQMISCHKGLAPISFPADWLKNFDMKKSFASVGGEGRIRFPHGRAWGVSVEHDGADVTPIVRELSQAEINSTDWGEFTRPWESYQTTRIFGCGKITRLN